MKHIQDKPNVLGNPTLNHKRSDPRGIIFLVAAGLLSLAACNPRDVKVVDEPTRLKINVAKNPEGASGPSETFSLGNYALASFLSEKQIEVIELIKLSSGSLAAAKSSYKIQVPTSSEAETDGSVNTVKIFSNDGEMDYSNRDGFWLAKNSKSLNVVLSEKQGIMEKLEIQGENLKSSVESSIDPAGNSTRGPGDGNSSSANSSLKTSVTLLEDTYSLIVKVADDNPSAFIAHLNMTGAIAGVKGVPSPQNKIGLNLEIIVDKESLKSDQVKIISSKVAMTYPGFNGKTFNLSIEGANLLINGQGLCFSLTGSLAAAAGPKNRFTLNAENNQISILGKNWVKPLASCGQRPSVDLSRFLSSF